MADGALVRISQFGLDVLDELLQFRRLGFVNLHVLFQGVFFLPGQDGGAWHEGVLSKPHGWG